MNNSVVACFYSFPLSHILVGVVSPKEKKLIITQQLVFENTDINKFALVLKQLASNNIWIATHEPLKLALGDKCKGELCFDNNEHEISSLKDVFLSLKSTEALLVDDLINLKSIESMKCLKVLLKATYKKFYKELSGFELWMAIC